MKNLTLFLLLFFQTLSLVFANGGVVDENYFKNETIYISNKASIKKITVSIQKNNSYFVIDSKEIEIDYVIKIINRLQFICCSRN